MAEVALRDFRDVENYLVKIPDIISSKILMDQMGQITEIHILAAAGRSPKQISRDIQSTLIAKYELQIDHKKISIAQIKSELKKDEIDFRFSIGAIGYANIGEEVEMRVVLKKGEDEFQSVVRGANSKRNTHRTLVLATLECVHAILGTENAFLFEDIKRVELTGQDAIVIAITYMYQGREESLLGSALIRKDEYESIVKATLDAVNRKMLQLSTNS